MLVAALVGVSAARAGADRIRPAATASGIDPAHDGFASSPGVTAPVQLLWSAPASDPTFALIADGFVIVTETVTGRSTSTRISALDARTGHLVWTRTLRGPFAASPPAFDRGRLFLGMPGGAIGALDVVTGRTLWTTHVLVQERSMVAGSENPPVASDGSLFVDGSGALVSMNEVDGSIRWSVPIGEYGGPPAVTPHGVFVSGGCEDYRFDRSGTLRWQRKTEPTRCFSFDDGDTVVASGGAVYVVNSGLIRDAADGSRLGQYEGPNGDRAIPAVANGRLFTVSSYGVLSAQDALSGRVVWARRSRRFVTRPIVMGPWVVVGSGDGHLDAFLWSSGARAWRVATGLLSGTPSTPGELIAAAGPVVVVPGGDRVVAFRAMGPWTLGPPPSWFQALQPRPKRGTPLFVWGLIVAAECLFFPYVPWWAPILRGRQPRFWLRRVERAIRDSLEPEEHVAATTVANAGLSPHRWKTFHACLLIAAAVGLPLLLTVEPPGPVRLYTFLGAPVALVAVMRAGLRSRRLVLTDRRLLVCATGPLLNEPREALAWRSLGAGPLPEPERRGASTLLLFRSNQDPVRLWVPSVASQRAVSIWHSASARTGPVAVTPAR
jgi:outer membrane protein assembly factor BamB